jgi:hypothetical protein
MDAIVAIDDRVIFFVEGAGQTGFGCSWGECVCGLSPAPKATLMILAACSDACQRLPQATAL